MMKITKIIFVGLCCFLFQNNSHAQSNEYNYFEGSIILGLNAAQLDGDDIVGYNRLGLQGGVQVSYLFDDRLSASVGLLYAQKGSASELGQDGNSPLQRIRLDYIEIPLLGHYRVRDIDFQLGASYGRLVKSDVLLTAYNNEDFDKNDFSLIVGATYYFADYWGTSFKFTRSVKDINTANQKNRLYGRLLSFQLLYTF